MKARVIKDTKIIDYPFLTIMKDTIVEVIGTENEDGTIVIRYNGHNYLVKSGIYIDCKLDDVKGV